MKQLGNLVIVCAQRPNTLFQLFDGIATVSVGEGSARRTYCAEWHDNAKIANIINELNFGENAGKE
jgi:hypothetical protein